MPPRPDGADPMPALLELYRDIDASTIGHVTDDGHVRDVQPLFRPVRLLGSAFTVRLPPVDGGILRPALIASRPGDVLVVQMAAGDEHRACWGELRTLAALTKGLAGVVLSGCATDVRALAALGFPVFARGVSPVTTRTLDGGGEIGVPVYVGGVTVRPGDLVVGDDDGVFVLEAGRAMAMAERLRERQLDEARRRRQLGAQVSEAGSLV